MKETIILKAKINKEEKKLNEVLSNFGIVNPHPSLGFFHFIYSPIEEANGNGVRLAEQAVEDSITQLRGTQANINHERLAGCGSIIDAWVNKDDEIEIVVSFFKNLFPEEYKEAIELAKEEKLFVSFELRTSKDNVEVLADGTKRLHDIEWEGVGILMNVKPAYKNAKILEYAMKEVEAMLQEEDSQLVYANAKDIVQKWTKIGEMIETVITEKQFKSELNKEDIIVDKKANDALLAKLKADVIAEFGEEAIKDWTDEDFTAEKIDALRESLKPVEEVVAEEVVEPVVEAKTVFVEEVTQKVTETIDSDAGTDSVLVETEQVRKVDDVVKETVKTTEERVYTFAEVEAIKADYEAKLLEKDAEIKFQKEFAQKIVSIRAEMGDIVKDLSDQDLFDETKMEIAKLRKENAELKAKSTVIASEEVVTAEELPTGHEDGIIVAEKEETPDELIGEYLKLRHSK